jgi:hypothetical protein
LKNIRKDVNIQEGSRICSEHFLESCFENGHLKSDAIPTVFEFKPKPTSTPRRELVRIQTENDSEAIDCSALAVENESNQQDAGTQTTGSPCWCDCHKVGAPKDAACQAKLADLNIDFDLKENDETTRFYTGLHNWATFLAFSSTLLLHALSKSGGNLLNYWGTGSLNNKRYHDGQEKPGPRRILPPLYELLITLLWYRHAFVEEHIRYMFKASTSTIS